MLQPVWKRNDRKAKWLIGIFSAIVFIAITALARVKLEVDLGFDPHLFALINAVLNSCVAGLLVAALIAVKSGKWLLHRNLMLTAMLLSVLFLLSYICHHLFTGETPFGGQGPVRTVYYIILFTHIPLAGLVLPFILFTAYRALTGDWTRHKKLARMTWPVWFYVAVTGVVVFLMISPYYHAG